MNMNECALCDNKGFFNVHQARGGIERMDCPCQNPAVRLPKLEQTAAEQDAFLRAELKRDLERLNTLEVEISIIKERVSRNSSQLRQLTNC